MSQSGDLGGDFVAGKLAALTRLRTLGHLDLKLFGRSEIGRGDTESSRSDLLDRGVARRPVALRAFASLARIGIAADLIHRLGQRFVGLPGQGAMRHGRCDESAHDPFDRFDLVERNRRPRGECEQIADDRRRPVEDLSDVVVPVGLLTRPHGLLQGQDDAGAGDMEAALASKLVEAAGELLALAVAGVQLEDPCRHLLETEPGEPAGGIAEREIAHVLTEADDLEELRAAVRRNRADPHLRHDLEQPGLESGPIVLLGHDRIDVDDTLLPPRPEPGRWRDTG